MAETLQEQMEALGNIWGVPQEQQAVSGSQQSPVPVPNTQPEILPPIQQPMQVAPADPPIWPVELQRKLFNGEVLTDAEVDLLNTSSAARAPSALATGLIDTAAAVTSPEGQAFMIAGGMEAGGGALGGLVGMPVLGMMAGSVGGSLTNQALGLENESAGNLLFAALSPAAVDFGSDVARSVGRKAAGFTRAGRASRAIQNTAALRPMALNMFAPELARQLDTASANIVRTRQSFVQAENQAFNALRAEQIRIDLAPVGEFIRNFDDDLVNMLRKEFSARSRHGQKFNQIVPRFDKQGRMRDPFDPDGTLFNGEELVDFRQRLDDIKNTMSTRSTSIANQQRIEIDRIKSRLDEVINNSAARMEANGLTGAAQRLRHANRVSQFRIANDEWTNLVSRAQGNLQIGRQRVPEINVGTIDNEIDKARQLLNNGQRGSNLDTFVRMVDQQQGGFKTWDDLMQSVRANSPEANITVFNPRDNFVTRSAGASLRTINLHLLNEAFLYPVSRKLLAEQFFRLGHTTVTRHFLAAAVTIGRTYSNMAPQDLSTHQTRQLLQHIAQAQSQMQIGTQPAPGEDVGALTQLLGPSRGAQPPAPTALGPESLQIPPGFERPRRPSPAGVMESELPPFLRGGGPFSAPRGSALPQG